MKFAVVPSTLSHDDIEAQTTFGMEATARGVTTGNVVDLRYNPRFVGYEDGESEETEGGAPGEPASGNGGRYRVYLGGDSPEHIAGSFEKLEMGMKYATLLYADHVGEPIFVKDNGKTIAVIGG